MSDLKRAIQRLSKKSTGFDATMELAIVQQVNEKEMTCSVILYDDKDLLLEEVKLKPIVPEADFTTMGIVTYPAVGSYVIIGQINNSEDDLFVVACTQIDKLSCDAGSEFKLLLNTKEGTMELSTPELTLNGGKQGGLPLINPLLDKINQLEEKVNGLLSDFKVHKHLGVMSGAAISGLSDKLGPSAIEMTKLADLENKSIKQ
ncbi:hypothetical protein ACSBL2_24605 [Pedobacter sp. AW31-3R]|uniref:hypothetical protein n=1 Tax=Pedobacter sp. AW31-3R TaxID=3445781 RepID=UPI003F9F2829